MQIDIAERHADPAVRQAAEDFVAVITPVVKAMFTDHGFEAANLAVQTYGGHGYIHEHGVEQFVRDARITQLYEGTNGIQALDLIGRKMPEGGGRLLRRFFHPMQEFLLANMGDEEMKEFCRPLMAAFAQLQQVTLLLAQKGLTDSEEAGAAASDYLRFFGLVAVGWMWARIAKTALERAAPEKSGGDPAGFYASKLDVARFYMKKVLPETASPRPLDPGRQETGHGDGRLGVLGVDRASAFAYGRALGHNGVAPGSARGRGAVQSIDSSIAASFSRNPCSPPPNSPSARSSNTGSTRSAA